MHALLWKLALLRNIPPLIILQSHLFFLQTHQTSDAIQRLSGEVECRPEMPKLDCVMEIDQSKEEEDEHDNNNYSKSSD